MNIITTLLVIYLSIYSSYSYGLRNVRFTYEDIQSLQGYATAASASKYPHVINPDSTGIQKFIIDF